MAKATVQKDREKDLLLSHFTIQNLHEAVFWIDSTARIFQVNDMACEMTGRSREELTKMHVPELNPSEIVRDFPKYWARLKKEKKIIFEAKHLHKSGHLYDVEITANIIEFKGQEFNCSIVRNIRQRKMEEELLRTVSEVTSGKVGQDFFEELTEYVTMVLKVKTCIVTECTDVDKTRVRTLAFTKNHELQKSIEYDVEGTPCKLVMQGKGSEVFIRTGCDKVYPKEAGYDSYVAVPINSPVTGDVLGHIAALDGNSMSDEQNQTAILKIFAARAGAELERYKAQQKLEKANEDLRNSLREIEHLKNQLSLENKYLQEEIKLNHNYEEIISSSKKFHKILQQIEQVASTDATVLILGESGTGKELIARAIHNVSNRSKRALVKVNCATLPANLIESELFGHERGAFTGAMEKKIGRFELADGGTIFLDEIGDLPVELQAKLLRVLQEGEFERLGNPKTMKVNVRVIAATNRDLTNAIEKKEFRQDLYYRLNVFPITCPPLRERKEDIPMLVKHFCQKYEGRMGKKINNIHSKVMDALMAYNWPGNIRELENMVERAIILSRDNSLEYGEWLPMDQNVNGMNSFEKMDDVEREHIIKTLKKTNWKVSGEKGAARILGLNPTTLEARMKKLGIERDK